MSEVNPSVFLRLGSHSERDYFDRIVRFADGYIIAANLVESTPAASASLVYRYSCAGNARPYVLDPMTYAFGGYTDPDSGLVRNDLDWIKSDSKRENRRDFKRSYRSLGEQYGGIFARAVSDPKSKRAAILPEMMSAEVIENMCTAVLSYQKTRLKEIMRDEMRDEPDAEHFIQEFPLPYVVLAPYFYVEPSRVDDWVNVNIRLLKATVAQERELPVHGVLCVDQAMLRNPGMISRLTTELSRTGIKGVWLWFSKLNEDDTADHNQLSQLRTTVETLSRTMQVFNMHGGFFSLALSKFGMAGISHGVGYGEQKDVVPVVGKGIPIVRYYLRDIHHRLGVPDLERSFKDMAIVNPEDFHDQICDCVICKGVVNDNLEQFGAFGELEPPKPDKKRRAQTPKAAKLCRYHFLLNRIRERDWVKKSTLREILQSMETARNRWCHHQTVRPFCEHLSMWIRVLGNGSLD